MRLAFPQSGVTQARPQRGRLATPSQGALSFGAASFGSTVRAVTVTADGTSHTKGAWTELIASTSGETNWVVVCVSGMVTANTDTRGLLDIGIGAAAAETAIITEIPAGFSPVGELSGFGFLLPIYIPPGSRVSARLQALISADTAVVALYCLNSPAFVTRSPSKLVTLNADTAASTSSTMMTVSNTYAQVTASTGQAFQGLIASPCGGAANNWSNDTAETLTLAVGASGSEVQLAQSGVAGWTNGEQIALASSAVASVATVHAARHVPAGSRVACKITTGRAYKGVIVFGVPYS